jgi:hypothetical protein
LSISSRCAQASGVRSQGVAVKNSHLRSKCAVITQTTCAVLQKYIVRCYIGSQKYYAVHVFVYQIKHITPLTLRKYTTCLPPKIQYDNASTQYKAAWKVKSIRKVVCFSFSLMLRAHTITEKSDFLQKKVQFMQNYDILFVHFACCGVRMLHTMQRRRNANNISQVWHKT